jgi:threonine dehydrogenase-like Zn-dependent dehydrogenase
MPPRPGAFAEFVCVPETNAVTMPEGMPFTVAALAEPIAVSWHAVRIGVEKLFPAIGAARVVVLGGGAIGLTVALVARLFGATDLWIGETNALRRETLERQPGLRVYAPGDADEPAENSADLVLDAVGAAATRAAASRLIRPGGVIVHIGLLPGQEGLDIRKITLQEITVTGSYCYTPADFAATLTALAEGRFGALDWIEERPLSAGQDAFVAIDQARIGAAKIILRP